MILGSQVHSLSNPMRGSALSTYGFKPSDEYVAFSVGNQAPGTGYLSLTDSGNNPRIKLNAGLLEFECPQDNLYIGIGDKVDTDLGFFYLNRKISLGKWFVTTASGSIPTASCEFSDNYYATDIDKVFSKLSDAISGAGTLIGETNLTLLGRSLYLPCYTANTTESASININGFTTDENNFIRIFAPYDIDHHCNQRNKFSLDGKYTGFVINSSYNLSLFEVSENYASIEGLHIELSSNTARVIETVPPSGKLHIEGNRFIGTTGGTSIAISHGTPMQLVCVNNVIAEFDRGVYLSDDTADNVIYNNTVFGCATSGITVPSTVTNTKCTNNIAFNASGDDFAGDLTCLIRCISKSTDISSGTECFTSVNAVNFMDSSSYDFRLCPGDKAAHNAGSSVGTTYGGYDLSEDTICSFETDIDGNQVDDTWCIGASHYVPTLCLSVMNGTPDVKTGTPTLEISASKVIFSAAQTNENMCAGMLVTHSGGSCYLREKIDDTHWWVTDINGGRVASVGTVFVTSITAQTDSLHEMLTDDGSGDSYIETITGSDNLTSLDIAVNVACVSESSTAGGCNMYPFTTDQTRRIKIYVPNIVGEDCNERIAHNGKWDDEGYVLYGSGDDDDALKINSPYTEVDSLQLKAYGNGLHVSGANCSIHDCIIKDCGQDGILWEATNPGLHNFIYNNLIYDCSLVGIDIENSYLYQREPFGDFYIFNNSILRCSKGIYFETDINDFITNHAFIINNLLYGNSEYDIDSNYTKSPTVFADYNWSSDRSIRNFVSEFTQSNLYEQTVQFKDYVNKDFHLSFYDSLRMQYAINLSTHPGLQIIDDYEGDSRDDYGWDIGSDNFAYPSGIDMGFSAGTNTSNLYSGTGASITGGILTLAEDPGADVGVGDKVVVDTTTAYIYEKGTSEKWVVRSADGSIPSDDSGSCTITRAISDSDSSLYAAFVSGDLSTILGGVDLVSQDIDVTVWCYNDSTNESPSGVISIYGWTTDEDHQIKIRVPWDTITQCNSRQRHTGVRGTGTTVIASASNAINIGNSYCVVEGLIISAPSNDGIYFSSGSIVDAVAKDNVIYNVDNGISQTAATQPAFSISNIIEDCDTYGISMNNGFVFNNTVINCETACFSNEVGIEVRNCIGQNSPNPVFQNTSTPNYNCISDDATCDNTNNGYRNITLEFLDSANHDFHLVRSDWPAIGTGSDLSGNSDYSFNHDIDIESIQPTYWCIGADCLSEEDYETRDVFFSVGKETGLKTGSGTVYCDILNSTIIFSEPQTHDNMGVGDKVSYTSGIDNYECYISGKISTTAWSVIDKFGGSVDDVNSAVVNSIEHTFDELGSALDVSDSDSFGELMGAGTGGTVYSPFDQLRNSKIRINIPCYRSTSSHTVDVNIEDYSTDKDHYINIYTPTSPISECNQNQRHRGNISSLFSGVNEFKISVQSGSDDGVYISTDYTHVNGIIIKGNVSSTSANGIKIESADECVIENNIIFDTSDGIVQIALDSLLDTFDGGVMDDYWDDEFQTNTTIEENVGVWAAYSDGSVSSYINLTPPAEPIGGWFDFGFDIYTHERGSNESFKCRFYDTAGYEQLFYYHAGSMEFNSVSMSFPKTEGRTYKIRVVRGGTVSSDGVFTVVPGSEDTIRFYYYDDFSDGDGTNTNTWKEHTGSPVTRTEDDGYLMVEGSDDIGFSQLDFRAETGLPYNSGTSDYEEFIINNIIYDVTGDGVETNGSCLVYNNLAYECGGYCFNNQDGDILINNIAQNPGAGSSCYNDDTDILYCVADDTSSGSNDGCIQNHFVQFVNSGGRDFHLFLSEIELRGSGKILIGDSYFPFNYDASNIIRGRFWDYGPLEYVASKKAVFSVGSSKGSKTLETKTDSNLSYVVSEGFDGYSYIEFDTPQTHDYIGVGDQVVSVGSGLDSGCFLAEKVTQSLWRVVSSTGSNVPSGSGYVQKIERAYISLQAALDDDGGVFDTVGSEYLASLGTQVSIACYNDKGFTGVNAVEVAPDGVNFSTYSDVDHFVKIFVPNDTEKECNINHGHNGIVDISGSGPGYLLSSTTGPYAILVEESHYAEITGLILSSQRGHGIDMFGVVSGLVSSNIIIKAGRNGINYEGSEYNEEGDRIVIVNNLVVNAGVDGIYAGNSEHSQSNMLYCIYNNTIAESGDHGINIDHISGGSASVILRNNLTQIAPRGGVVEQYGLPTPDSDVDFGIDIGDSLDEFSGINNQIRTKIEFINDEQYDLNIIEDSEAIDQAYDLSDDIYYPFSVDIKNVEREPGKWDIGAFESVSISGVGMLILGPLFITSSSTVYNEPETEILYLRENQRPNLIDGVNQFDCIESGGSYPINDRLAELKTRDVIIYVEGGASFTSVAGAIDLTDRGNRSALIKTDPGDIAQYGSASLMYGYGNNYLIEASGTTGDISFEQLKIYSADSTTTEHFIDPTSEIEYLKIINTILQMNSHGVIGDMPDTKVKILNSELIYSDDDSGVICVAETSVPDEIEVYNSIAVINTSTEITFKPGESDATSDHSISHCIIFNYGGDILNGFLGTKSTSVSVVNPDFQDAVVQEVGSFTPSEVMSFLFKVSKTSPAVNSGENSFINDEGVSYDIRGFDRIFESGFVDIGSYELRILQLYFSSDKIREVFQDKLVYRESDKSYKSTAKSLIYFDLYNEFDEDKSMVLDYPRESKVVVRIKDRTDDYVVFSDKPESLVYEMTAYFDYTSNSIIIKKPDDFIEDIFRNMFSGKYNFYFDQITHRLKVYINETYNKGLSGGRNLVKNIKFGGPSIMRV